MIICILLSVSFVFYSMDSHDDFPTLREKYLGQTPPGMKAEPFDPGIFPDGNTQGSSGFLYNGTVFVYTTCTPEGDWRLMPTLVTELKDGKWTKPEIAPFTNYYPYNFTVGPDGQTIWFTSLKSPDKTTSMIMEQANIWVVKLEINGWTEPVVLGRSINTEKYYENYPAVATNGTIYYMSRREEGIGKTDVFRSVNLGGKYAKPENLGTVINTKESDQDPFIAPDESYIIVCQRKPEGLGQYDLYINFRKADGSWTESINMGKNVDSSDYEFRPYVTPDGKYLFFTSDRPNPKNGNIHWVDAKVIENLKPADLKK